LTPLLASLPRKLEARVPKPPRPIWMPVLVGLAALLVTVLGLTVYLLTRDTKKKLPVDPNAAIAPEEEQPDEPEAVLPSLPASAAVARPAVTVKKKGIAMKSDARADVPPPRSADLRKLGERQTHRRARARRRTLVAAGATHQGAARRQHVGAHRRRTHLLRAVSRGGGRAGARHHRPDGAAARGRSHRTARGDANGSMCRESSKARVVPAF
jgi:hypothetical protein